MKGILEFDLNDLDDRLAHERAVKATDMALVLWHLIHNTRRDMMDKINRALEEDKNFTPHDSLDIIYDELQRLLEEHAVIPDALIV